MTGYGVSTAWHENERLGELLSIERVKHGVTTYRVECRWWRAHLAYCETLKPWTASRWLDTVEGWVDSVDRLGYGEAIFEINRLRKEAGLCGNR
mgnify:CR=1 FL=1